MIEGRWGYNRSAHLMPVLFLFLMKNIYLNWPKVKILKSETLICNYFKAYKQSATLGYMDKEAL